MPGEERHVEGGGINYVVEQLVCEHPAQYPSCGLQQDLQTWRNIGGDGSLCCGVVRDIRGTTGTRSSRAACLRALRPLYSEWSIVIIHYLDLLQENWSAGNMLKAWGVL